MLLSLIPCPTAPRPAGVDTDSMLISQPDSGEQALEIADTLVRSGGLDVVVVDSVAALVPRAEAEGEMGDHHMALQARLMSQALRKLTSSLSRADTLIIFINQIRSKVGVMFGSPEVTAGGNALKYYASVRIDIRRRAPIKRGDEVRVLLYTSVHTRTHVYTCIQVHSHTAALDLTCCFLTAVISPFPSPPISLFPYR